MSFPQVRNYISEYILELSSRENIGSSRNLNNLKDTVLNNIFDGSIYDKRSCGKSELRCLIPVYLDEDTTPCVLYELYFTDLKISLEIKAMCFYDWYYYPESIRNVEGSDPLRSC